MPRKSTRVVKKKLTDDSDGEYDPDKRAGEGGGSADDEEFAPPAKKAKKATSSKGKGKAKATPAKRGRKKKLEVFNSMPLDVLALIMSQLDTKTLLAMSRTCSTFRSVLHADQGLSIWKDARRNSDGMPDLKAGDVKEWEYASLVYDSSCHVCHKPRANTVDFTLRARACAKCMRANSNQRKKTPGGTSFHSLTWECCHESLWSPGLYGEPLHFWWLPTLKQVSKRLFELQGEDGYDDYVAACKHINKNARTDGVAIERWQARQKRAGERESDNATASRQRKIKEKLLELGYIEKEFAYSQVNSHSLFNQPRDLTDRIWNSIKDTLTGVLDQERVVTAQAEAAKAMRARADILRPFYDSIHSAIPSSDQRSLFPPFPNFLMLPTVREFYEPEDAKPTQEDLAAAKSAIMSEASAFASEIKIALYANLAKAHADAATKQDRPSPTSTNLVSADEVEQLAKLVTSAVSCPGWACTTMATFPAILDHYKVCGSQSLTAESLKTTAERILAIRYLLDQVNAVEPDKVSETSSTAALYALGDAFTCQDCTQAQPGFGATTWSTAYQRNMSWARMIQHITAKHTNQGVLTLPSIEYKPPEAVAAEGEANEGGGFLSEEDW
ncbi:hypothetical protein JCM10207_002290 [Rhodosporidiobolus poonsookiae]